MLKAQPWFINMHLHYIIDHWHEMLWRLQTPILRSICDCNAHCWKVAWAHGVTNTHERMRDCHLCWVPLARVHHSWAHPCNPCPHVNNPPGGLWRLHGGEWLAFFDTSGPIPSKTSMATGLTAVIHKHGHCNRIPCSWCGHSNETPLLKGLQIPTVLSTVPTSKQQTKLLICFLRNTFFCRQTMSISNIHCHVNIYIEFQAFIKYFNLSDL